MTKKFCLSHLISEEPYIILLSFTAHLCKMIISPGVFFHFSKILIFWVVGGIKVQKIVQNDSCLLHSVAQQPYIIRLSFMVHMCKMIISPGLLHFLKILIFWVVRGVKGQKLVQNDKKFCPSHSIHQEPYII